YSGALIATIGALLTLGPLRTLAYRIIRRYRAEVDRLLVEVPAGGSPAPLIDAVERKGGRVVSLEIAQEGDRRSVAMDVALHGTGHWVMGEDWWLEVDALGGRPGIGSARYAPEGAPAIAKLLGELDGVRERAAHYVSELVCLTPDDEEVRGSGTLTGRIAEEPGGDEGFGYDPVFVPDGEERTVAELGNEWKVRNSHRARAARALLAAVGAALLLAG